MGLFGMSHKKKLETLWAIRNKHSRTVYVGPTPPEETVRRNIIQIITDRTRMNVDCIAIMQSTHNPETFYQRLDLFRENIAILTEIEAVDASFFESRPSALQKKIEKAIGKEESAMWERSFATQVEIYKAAKTDAARQKAMSRHFDFAERYIARMGDGAKKAIEKHRKTAVKKYGYEG